MQRFLLALLLLAGALVLASGGCASSAGQRAAHDAMRWIA